jgi:hypothetical protein
MVSRAIDGVDSQVAANMPLGKLINHTSVRDQVRRSTADSIQNSTSRALTYMRSDSGVLGAGGNSGREGLARMMGAMNMMRGQRAQIRQFRKGIDGSGADAATRASLRQEARQAAMSPGRYASAARDMGVGAWQYMNSGNAIQRAAKMGVAGAGWMAGNTMLRGANGGSFGYNNDGERDIAGIPFI